VDDHRDGRGGERGRGGEMEETENQLKS